MARLSISGTPRSERMVAFVTEKTRADLQKVAMVQRTSMNELLNVAIEWLLREHQNDIQRYNAFFGEE